MTNINQTPRDADADLAICNAATPGPWFADGGGMCVGVSQGACPQDRGVSIVDDVTTPNAKLIAISREALPYWIKRCRAAETRVMYCSFCRAEFPPDTDHDVLCQHSMTCEKSPVVQEVDRLKKQYAEEVDEFNAGYQAAKDGLPESAEPFHCPHDVWMCGYAWGKFEALKAEVEQLREANVFALSENARMKNTLEEIEQVGHNPAHLACDLMDAHPGMEERLWALVNRLADMANQQVCIAHDNRKALYCNEGPQGSNWFDVMARLRHAILPEINADSTFLTVAQVRTLVAEIEKLESLVAEADREAVRDKEIYLHAYKLIGACDISNFLAKCEQAKGFEEREYDLEREIARLKQIITNMEENP